MFSNFSLQLTNFAINEITLLCHFFIKLLHYILHRLELDVRNFNLGLQLSAQHLVEFAGHHIFDLRHAGSVLEQVLELGLKPIHESIADLVNLLTLGEDLLFHVPEVDLAGVLAALRKIIQALEPLLDLDLYLLGQFAHVVVL